METLLANRVEALERTVRRQRSFLGLAALVALGGVLVSADDAPLIADEIHARRFIVTRDDGSRVAQLGMRNWPMGTTPRPALVFYGKDQLDTQVEAEYGLGHMHVRGESGSSDIYAGRVSLHWRGGTDAEYLESGRTAQIDLDASSGVSVTDRFSSGSAIGAKGVYAPGVSIFDDSGTPRASLGMLEDESATLTLNDSDGTPRIIMLSSADDHGLSFVDPNGTERVTMGCFDDSKRPASVTVMDSNQAFGVSMMAPSPLKGAILALTDGNGKNAAGLMVNRQGKGSVVGECGH